jgi:transposase, IS30 family
MPSGVGRGRRLSDADRAEIRARIHAGEQYRAVAAVVGCDPLTVQKVVAHYGGVASRMRPRAALRLAAAEREAIARGLVAQRSVRQIAAALGRAPSTIAREVRRNGGPRRYWAWQAEQRAELAARRSRCATGSPRRSWNCPCTCGGH